MPLTAAVRATIAMMCVAVAAACRINDVSGPDAFAGDYVLVTVAGEPLPAHTLRTVWHSGALSLERDRRFMNVVTIEVCLPEASCRMTTDTTTGTWLVLHDGTLYFDAMTTYGWPAPVIRADGTRIEFWPAPSPPGIGGSPVPGPVYVRR